MGRVGKTWSTEDAERVLHSDTDDNELAKQVGQSSVSPLWTKLKKARSEKGGLSCTTARCDCEK